MLTHLLLHGSTVHLIGHYILEDYAPMDDSDEESDEFDLEEQEVDEEIDSDEAGDIDLTLFGLEKKSASKKGMCRTHSHQTGCLIGLL